MPAKTFFAFPVLTALVVFALYFLTAFSDVPGGDAGELLAEGCSAGVAHPPGYPLYTMLLWTVTTGIRRLLMLGEEVDGGNAAVGTNSSFGEVPGAPAWRANVLSCALGAIAASFVCATVQIWSFLIWEKTHERLGSTRGAVLEGFAGMSAGLLFALSSLVWTYSITAEVFALNNALCAALLLGSAVCTLARERTSAGLACEHAPEIAQHLMDKGGDVDAQGKERVERERLERKRRSMDPTMIHTEGCAAALVASAAIAGLSLCNQHTALFFAAPLSLAEAVWWLYWALMGTRRSATNVRLTILNWLAVGILTGTAFFVLPHAYLVITALRGGVRGSWGNTGSVQGLIAHVLRREYGTFALSPMKNAGDGTTIAGLGERNEMFFEAWVNEEDTGFVLPLGSGLAATMGLASAFAVPSLTMRASRWQGKRHWLGARSLGLAVASFLALATYLIVFHSLANLPLDAPMPFEVHRRFWMQPALILCTWSGIGIRSFQIFIAGAFGLFRKSGRRRAIDALRLFGKIFRGGRNRSHSREHEEQKPKPKVDQGNRGKGKGGARGTRVAGRNSIKKKGKHKGAKARETGTTPQTAKSRSKSLQKLEEELPHLPWPRAQSWLRFLLYGMHTCIAVAAITTAAQRVGVISATLPHSLWPPSSWLAPTSLGYRVGGAMGRYGRALLSSIPEGALLLSHTDLNWNTVRYLQHCEGLRQDVTHLSLQLMPFPWFGTSNEPGRQSQLYPGVSFPNILPSASTQLGDAGNAALIVRFVEANAKRIAHGGIFLDLHAVSDAKIGAGGVYADRLRLLPHEHVNGGSPNLTTFC